MICPRLIQMLFHFQFCLVESDEINNGDEEREYLTRRKKVGEGGEITRQ